MEIYEEEAIERDELLELKNAASGGKAILTIPPCISQAETRAILESQQALSIARQRGSLRDVGRWIEQGHLSSKVAQCSAAVGLLISRSNLRRRQTSLPMAGDCFEPRLSRYGIWRDLRCNDFLYLETGFSAALGTCCLTGSNQVLTARHVLDQPARDLMKAGDLMVLFDFGTLADSRARHVFSEHQSVFRVVDDKTGEGEEPDDDWAQLTLERSPTLASGRLPVQSSSDPLTTDTAVFTLGHPKGLPMRYGSADAITVELNCPRAYRAYLDGYVVASGSPVFRADTCELIGVMTDACSVNHKFGRLWAGDKYVSTVCTPRTGCQGSLFIGLP